ncbi:MAG TPA: hypothetical protein VFD71_08615 [Planctomycetota bacterium]|nr:hypothetical protein [Planctomycetota bacterium]
MPRFHWKGRSTAGHEIEGDTSAASKDAVVAQLGGQGITVTTVSSTGDAAAEASGSSAPAHTAVAQPLSMSERLARDRASSKPRPFCGALVASGFFVGALALGYFVPVTFVRCERSAGSVTCTLSEKDLGFVTIREQSLAAVTKVDVEPRASEHLSDGRDQSRLVLANAAGASIRPSGWDHYGGPVRTYSGRRQTGEREPTVGATTDAMRRDIAAFLEDSTSAGVSSWQGQYVPLLIAGVLAGIGLLILGLSALALFQGPTDWIYAMTGRLAAAAAASRRQQGR